MENVPSASQSPSLDSEDPQVVFQWQVVGVKQQLLDEMRVGMETPEGTLEEVHRCLSPSKNTSEAIKCTYPSLHRTEQSLADIASVMRQRQQQQSCQCDTSEVATQLGAIRTILFYMEQKQDSYIATMGAFDCNIVALLTSLQTIVSALLPSLLAQTNAATGREATSSAPDVCAPQIPPAQIPLPSGEAQHASEEEDVDFTNFRKRSTQ